MVFWSFCGQSRLPPHLYSLVKQAQKFGFGALCEQSHRISALSNILLGVSATKKRTDQLFEVIFYIPVMSELTVKDRNKRKSGDLSSEEESIVTNPEKKHEGSNTFFPEAAAAGAAMSTGRNSAPCTPTWPPRGGQNQPKATSSWLKAQQANEKIDGSTSTASGPNQLPAGAFKAPTKEDLMDVCEKMSQ